jgi:hypothetical protein
MPPKTVLNDSLSTCKRHHINRVRCADAWTFALPVLFFVLEAPAQQQAGMAMAKKAKKIVRREYTKADVKELRAHSKARTPVAKISKLMKRSEGSLRQKALKLGIRLGHVR